MYKSNIKPWFEFFISIVLLVFFLPIIFGLTVLGILFLGGNPFFIQNRSGLAGKVYRMIKFRTMKHGNVTKYGNLLRRFSLDELPQLFNVLMGQMSLIGPRPLLPEYLPIYNEFQKRRLLVKPGISGWAQVNGRNAISWEEKFKLDVWYIENMSFSLDIKIVLKTIFQLRNKNTSPATPFIIHNS